MKTLSQKKKLGILSLSILALTVVGLISTGTMTMSDLRSNILGTTSPSYTCTENSHKRNLREYNQSVENQADTQEQLNTISGEITVLQNKIAEHRGTITLKQAAIVTRPDEILRIQGLITPLTTYINKNCKPGNNTKVCNEKKKARSDYEREIRGLKNLETDIKKLETTIRGLEWQVTALGNSRTSLTDELQRLTSFIQDYETCEQSLKNPPIISGEITMSGEISIFPPCSYTLYTVGLGFDVKCEYEKQKVFQGNPILTGMEYNFVLAGSETRDSVIKNITFFLKNTNDQKIKMENIRLSKGITTDDLLTSCEKLWDKIECVLPIPLILKKQEVLYGYLNSDITILKNHTFELDVRAVWYGDWSSEKYNLKRPWARTNLTLEVYNKMPFQGELWQYTDSEDEKIQQVKFGGSLQTIYEFKVQANQGDIALTDIILDSIWVDAFEQEGEFTSCTIPANRDTLFSGKLELYDGGRLIAKSEDYAWSYTRFDITNPLVVKKNTEKKLTIKAKTQKKGDQTKCSFHITSVILASQGSYYTVASRYITHIK